MINITRDFIGKIVSGLIALGFLITYIASTKDLQLAGITNIGIDNIANAIFKEFVLAFEVLSILLLAALIGAIYLAKKEAAE